MSIESFDLVHSFVEDCRDHLDSIEVSLLDIEAAGAHQDPELVNSVFRLAHSIKGGAGMLGLDNIKSLAHKLENVLHMVRSNELFPSHEVVSVLLKGFDRLTALVDNIADSEGMSIDEQVELLVGISNPGQPVDQVQPQASIKTGHAGIFKVDALSLEQAKSGGNDLYLLEFDLIHDIHGKGRMPFDVLKSLADTGRIVDCKVDFAAVGDLSDFGNSIPFYVLYATILEPHFVCGLVKLPPERVRPIEDAPEALSVCDTQMPQGTFGALTLAMDASGARLDLAPSHSLEDLHSALIAASTNCTRLVIDWAGLSKADVFFIQLIRSAQRTFAKQGKTLCAAGPLPQDLRQSCIAQGLGTETPGCILPLA